MAQRTRTLLAVLALAAALAACAPSTDDRRQEVQQLTEPVRYYPTQTGVRWSYLPSGAPLSDPRVRMTVEGPTVLEGEVWIATSMVGRGLDVRWYRQLRSDGVYLAREERPGTIITFDPPIRELPREGDLRVGQTWSGTTTAQLRFPEARPENREATLEVQYVTTVVDRREVTVAAGSFEVFVLNFTSRSLDEEGEVVEELTQEIWFAPFVGEVRTENGYFLVDANFLDRERAEEDGRAVVQDEDAPDADGDGEER